MEIEKHFEKLKTFEEKVKTELKEEEISAILVAKIYLELVEKIRENKMLRNYIG